MIVKKEIDGITVEAKSIVTALKVIKTVCEDNYVLASGRSQSCPFLCGKDNCMLQDSKPWEWNINDTGNVWKALV